MNYNRLTEKDGDIFVDGIDIIRNFAHYDGKGIIYYGYSYGLVSSLYCENMSEIRYVRELVSRKIDCNFPLLICDCDLDFSCTVIVVKVKFYENCVKWEKIGVVAGKEKRDSRTFFEKYRNSGIRRVEDWTEQDWEKYGDIAYDLLQYDEVFHGWCSNNWQEELYRRCWGYYHRYFNNDENIDWVEEIDFKFELNEYQKFFLRESV